MAKKVFLYALSTCIHCRNVKKFLDEKNINYDFVDVDQLSGAERDEVIEQVKKYNPRISFPTTVVDNEKIIIGLKEDEILEACGK